MQPMTLTELKRRFLEYLEIERGRSLKTIENYDHYLSRFIRFLMDAGRPDSVDSIDDESVRSFRLWLNRQPGNPGTSLGARSGAYGSSVDTLKKRTQNYYLIALRAFLKYMARMGVASLPAERIELAKVGARQIDLIESAELERLLASPDPSDEKGARDRAIMELLFSTGLRVSELCSLPRDLNLQRDEFSIRGKGEKIRVVFMSERAKSAVRAYLAMRKDMDPALFVRIPGGRGRRPLDERDGLRLTYRQIERIVTHHAQRAGLDKKVTPHVIRHSFATDLLSNGADIRSVQAMLGHASIITTQVYTHVTDKHLRDIHKRFHGKTEE